MSFEACFPDNELVFQKGDTEMRVIPDRCLISGMKVGNWDVLYRPLQSNNLMRAGLPLMVPNFSSLAGDKTFIETGRKLPHHGFGRIMPWTVGEKRADGISCYMENDDVTYEMYPFKFKITMNATVLGNGSIRHETIIENRETDRSLPIQPGLHPYFTCAQEDKKNMEVDFEGFKASEWTWETKETAPDYHVGFDKKATIKFPNLGTLEITEEPENDSTYHYRRMQIWSEPNGARDHHFVCYEPVVWGANGLNDPKTRLNVPAKGTVKLSMVFKATPKN